MKLIILILFSSFVSFACDSPDSEQVPPIDLTEQHIDLFTRYHAERILGEPAELTESTTRNTSPGLIQNLTYSATSPETNTGKTGIVYFMYEEYADAENAHKSYSSIYTANADNGGVKVLNDLADEAYFHTDSENFLFILVRKGEKMFRIKVNKITEKTSLNEFNDVAREIVISL